MKKSTLPKVTSLGDLRQKAAQDARYVQLAIVSANNLGGNAQTFDAAMRWLELNASEGGSEDGVIDEVNFCRDLAK